MKSIRRSHIYIAAVALVFAAAVGLRVNSEHHRGDVRLRASTPASEPRDYVAHPWVMDGERDAGPRRIISLAPSITEVICALGLRDRLVGRTQFCQYPPGIESVPTVGALTDTNYDLIKSLEPDVIFVTENSQEVIRKLRQLHLRCELVPHNTLDEVYTAILRVGDLCGRPRTARALVGSIWADIDSLHRSVIQKSMPRRRVLVTLGELQVPPRALFVAGPGSFFESMLELAGQTNAAREVLKSSHGEIPLEKLITVDPDVILEFRERSTAETMSEVYASWSAVGSLKAIRERQVRTVGGPEWLSASPRIAICLHRFITALSDAH